MTPRVRTAFRRLPLVAAVVAVTLPLPACQHVLGVRMVGGEGPLGTWIEDRSRLEAPKRVAVVERAMVHRVVFGPEVAEPSPTETDRLAAFLAETGTDRDDRVHVIAAAADPLADARLAAVGRWLEDRGAPVFAMPDGANPAPPEPGTVEVVLLRHVAVPPQGCPDWTDWPGETFENDHSSNFGCATATNRALMVAHPRDLVQGRAMDPMDGTFAAGSMKRYRDRETEDLIRGYMVGDTTR